MKPRTATIHRKTNETDIRQKLNLDGRGKARITTGIRFFDHMLELVARHGAFDLDLHARGDLHVDQHHTVEDLGVTLGEAVQKALGSKRGILRRIFPHAHGRNARRRRSWRPPLLRRERQDRCNTRRRFPGRAPRRLFPRLRASRTRQHPSARPLWPLLASSSRSNFQSLRPRTSFRSLARQAFTPGLAQHKRLL